jgi:hypothetical protein
MIRLSLALFRAKQITGFITFINASLWHVGQCTGIERGAKHSEPMRIFQSWGQDFLYLQTYPYRLGRMCATVGDTVPRDNYGTRRLPVLSYVHSNETKRFQAPSQDSEMRLLAASRLPVSASTRANSTPTGRSFMKFNI